MNEPRNLDAYVVWFLREWAAEMPSTIHKAEVFAGPPDGPRVPQSKRLGAERSTVDELVGGSVLGSPAYNESFRRLLEDDDPHREEPAVYSGSLTRETHLVTPMRSALRRIGRMFGAYLVDVAHSAGDWYGPARARGCFSEHIARTYALEAFRRLYREFQVELPPKQRKAERRRHYSDDVPWTQLSESQQRALGNGENEAA